MSDAPDSTDAIFSAAPHVDLLPLDVTQSLRVATTVRRTAIAGVIIAFLAALTWWSAGPGIDSAASNVEQLQSDNDRIQSEVNALAPVGTFYGQLERLEGLVSDTVASAPRAVATLTRMDKAARSAGDVRFVKLSLVYHGIPRTGDDLNRCPSPDPFSERITIGCIDFSATAGSRDEVATFISLLEKDPFFIGPYVSSTTSGSGESRITFTGTVGVGLDGLVLPLTDDSVIAAITSTDDTSINGEAP